MKTLLLMLILNSHTGEMVGNPTILAEYDTPEECVEVLGEAPISVPKDDQFRVLMCVAPVREGI